MIVDIFNILAILFILLGTFLIAKSIFNITGSRLYLGESKLDFLSTVRRIIIRPFTVADKYNWFEHIQ